MPWQLTAPIDTGDLDSGSYAEIQITSWHHDVINNIIMVSLEYGNTVDESWVRGMHPITKTSSVVIESGDYIDLITNSEPNQDETTYDAVKRGLYEYLEASGIIDAGSII